MVLWILTCRATPPFEVMPWVEHSLVTTDFEVLTKETLQRKTYLCGSRWVKVVGRGGGYRWCSSVLQLLTVLTPYPDCYLDREVG